MVVDEHASTAGAHRPACRDRSRPGRGARAARPAGGSYVVVPLSGSVEVRCTDVRRRRVDECRAGRPGLGLRRARPTSPTSRRDSDLVLDRRPSRAGWPSPSPSARRAGSGRCAEPSGTSRAADVPVELRGAGMPPARSATSGCPACSTPTRSSPARSSPRPATGARTRRTSTTTDRAGVETELEEIYYFEVQAARPRRPAGRRPDRLPAGLRHRGPRPIDVLAEVRTGDVVLVPHGWHGPAMAAPGYDLYYLNVMAGPGTRAGLADLRRPGPRLGPRHLDRPARRPDDSRSPWRGPR